MWNKEKGVTLSLRSNWKNPTSSLAKLVATVTNPEKFGKVHLAQDSSYYDDLPRSF